MIFVSSTNQNVNDFIIYSYYKREKKAFGHTVKIIKIGTVTWANSIDPVQTALEEAI